MTKHIPDLRRPLQDIVDEIIEHRCRQLDTIIVLASILLGALLMLAATEAGWVG